MWPTNELGNIPVETPVQRFRITVMLNDILNVRKEPCVKVDLRNFSCHDILLIQEWSEELNFSCKILDDYTMQINK